MYSDLIHFIYKTTNGIAAGKYDPEAECVLSEIIEQELLGINSRLLIAAKEEGETGHTPKAEVVHEHGHTRISS